MIPPQYRLPFVDILHRRMAELDPLIQVLSGPRQVGKTTGVLQFLESYKKPFHYALAEAHVSPQYTWLLEQWQVALGKGAETLLVLDEIQKVTQWSEGIKYLWDGQKREGKNRLKVILLGSSSLTLQKGLTEGLTGRFELIRIHHWNYHESNECFGLTLDDYLRFGGYPAGYAFLKEPDRWRDYLRESVVETVIGKDILLFGHVRQPALFRQAFEILCGYPAQEISYYKLLGQLQDKGNTDLVKHYIELYSQAYLVATLQKFSPKVTLKKASSPKILPQCPALVGFAHSGPLMGDYRGRLFELAVGLELSRVPGELYYWREGARYEVDYVVKTADGLFAVEVKSGRKKSLYGLEKFCGLFKKAHPIIITPDNFADLSRAPIKFLQNLS